MANTGLEGPWPLTSDTIDKVVTEISPGAYALGKANAKGLLTVKRVGRSDENLNKRLHDYVDDYSHFKCQYYGTAKEAFEKECSLWHNFKPEDNPNHPDKPTGMNPPCPHPGCNQ